MACVSTILKSLLFVSIGLLSLHAHATEYVELDIKFSIKDKGKKSSSQVNQPRVIAQMGQAAMITEEREDGSGFHITVLPEEEKIASNPKSLLLKFEVSDIRKGQKVFMGSPQIHVAPGRQARITQRAEDGSIIDLTVTPTFKPEL